MSHLKDPTTQYYTGEYPKQKQPTPGIQAKMTPVPDCGEKTYVGSGRLKDRKALVTGGDSGIGRAAAIAYAREGADVAISYLPVEEEDAQDVKKIIEECGRKAVLLPGDLSDEKFARSLVHEAHKALGGLDIMVAPGPIWTALQISGGQTQDKIPQFGQKTPMKRAGQPAELAPVYVYLASQESSYVTAEVHGVCGGEHLG